MTMMAPTPTTSSKARSAPSSSTRGQMRKDPAPNASTEISAPLGTGTAYGVSVVIPMRRGQYPYQAISYLQSNTYDGPVEIVIVEGSSPSLQRNEAVRTCTSDIVYFLDDDSFVSPTAISEGMKILEDKRIAVVGGPALTHSGASLLETSIGEAFSSIFGGCVTRGRAKPVGHVRLVEGEELVLCNLMMRKSAYQDASGLKTSLYPGEDPELIKRLRKSGELICYHPGMIVHRTRRKSVRAFVKQCFAYGSGRGQHICEGTRARDLLFLVPSAFLVYLVGLCCLPTPVTAIPLIAYFVLAYLCASQIGFTNRSLPLALYMVPIFFIMHVSYGAGLIFGLVSYALKLQRKRSSEIKITLLPLSRVEPTCNGSLP